MSHTEGKESTSNTSVTSTLNSLLRSRQELVNHGLLHGENRKRKILVMYEEQQQQEEEEEVEHQSDLFLVRHKSSRRSKGEVKMTIESLEMDVNDLKQQVQTLSNKRHLLHSRSLLFYESSRIATAKRIVQYQHDVFRHGMNLSYDWKNCDGISRETQEAVLSSTMIRDLSIGGQKGLSIMIFQLQRYSQYHDQLTLVSPNEVLVLGTPQEPIIVTRQSFRARVTRLTLECIYPHILLDEQLAQGLIGREIVYPCVFHYYFREDGKIMRYESEVDFITALTNLLEDFQKAVEILSHAMVSGTCFIGDREESPSPLTSPVSSPNGTSSRRNSIQKSSIEFLLGGTTSEEEEAEEEAEEVEVIVMPHHHQTP